MTEVLNFLQFGLFVKLFALVLVFFYFVFAAIVYRQIVLMTQILDSKISPMIRAFAVAHVVAVGILFFVGLFLA